MTKPKKRTPTPISNPDEYEPEDDPRRQTPDPVSEEQASPAGEEETPPVSEEQASPAGEEIDPTAALAAALSANAQLQQKLNDTNAAFAPLKDENESLKQQLAAAQQDAFSAVAPTLREFAAAANPSIPSELITGNTPDEIAASIERAAVIVDKVKAANPAPPSVPAGAPGRLAFDTAGMTPAQKIDLGWQQRAKAPAVRPSSKVERP